MHEPFSLFAPWPPYRPNETPTVQVRENALMDDVLTVDELRTGDDKRGTGLEGMHPELLLRALQRLEQSGRARYEARGRE